MTPETKFLLYVERLIRQIQNLAARNLSAAFTAGIRIFSAIASLAFSIVGARLLGAEAFGNYVSLMTAASLGAVIISFGLPQLLERELAHSRGSGDRASLVPIAKLLCISSSIILFATILTNSFWDRSYALVLAFMTLSGLAGVLAAIHAGLERVLLSAWVTGFWRPIAALVFLLALAAFGSTSLISALGSQIAGVAVSIALLAYFLFTRNYPDLVLVWTDVRNGDLWDQQHTRALSSALTFAAVQLVINATTQVDIIVLTALADSTVVAHYYAAARAANVISFFYGASIALASPTIVRLVAKGDIIGTARSVREAAMSGSILTVCAACVAAAGSHAYLSFYGPSFTEAKWPLIILLIGFCGMSLLGPAQPVLLAFKKERVVFAITLTSLGVNALVSFLLVPSIGMSGAAIGTCVQLVCYMGGQSAACYFLCGVRTDVFQNSNIEER